MRGLLVVAVAGLLALSACSGAESLVMPGASGPAVVELPDGDNPIAQPPGGEQPRFAVKKVRRRW